MFFSCKEKIETTTKTDFKMYDTLYIKELSNKLYKFNFLYSKDSLLYIELTNVILRKNEKFSYISFYSIIFIFMSKKRKYSRFYANKRA